MDSDDRESDRERKRKGKMSSEKEIREHEGERRNAAVGVVGFASKDEKYGVLDPAHPEQNQLTFIPHHQDEAVEEDHTHGGTMLFVGNLHHAINADDLRKLFELRGDVEDVILPINGHGNLGYGYIRFAQLENAWDAHNMDGQFEIKGRLMKVCPITNHAWMP